MKEDITRMAREAGFTNPEKFTTTDENLKGILSDFWENLERFAALVAAAERQKSIRLWMLLDNIDTADDIAKSDDRLYRSICQKYQKKRWEILSGEEVDAAIRARGNT